MTYPELISLEIAAAVSKLQLKQDLRSTLEALVQQVARLTLDNLRTTEDAAQAWGVSRRRAIAHIEWLHEKRGVGVKLSYTWLLTAEELAANRPGKTGRPKKKVEAF